MAETDQSRLIILNELHAFANLPHLQLPKYAWRFTGELKFLIQTLSEDPGIVESWVSFKEGPNQPLEFVRLFEKRHTFSDMEVTPPWDASMAATSLLNLGANPMKRKQEDRANLKSPLKKPKLHYGSDTSQAVTLSDDEDSMKEKPKSEKSVRWSDGFSKREGKFTAYSEKEIKGGIETIKTKVKEALLKNMPIRYLEAGNKRHFQFNSKPIMKSRSHNPKTIHKNT